MSPSTGYSTATIQNPAGALTDFSLLVDLSIMPASWWTEQNDADPTKGRAFKDDGVTELPVDWIGFDAVAKTGLARIRYEGTLAGSGTQKIRIYPPHSGNTSVLSSAVYGRDNAYDPDWALYLPFEGDANDRTSFGNDMTVEGAPTIDVAGQVSKAYSFDGVNDAVSKATPGAELKPNSGYTLMSWALSDVSGANETLSDRSSSSNPRNWQWYMSGGKMRLLVRDTAGHTSLITGTQLVSTSFQHFAAVRDAASSELRLYANGASDATPVVDATAGNTINSNTDEARVGARYTPSSNPWGGDIDEFQIHKTVRSVNWISEEFDQGDSQAVFWGTWSWNAPAPVPSSSGMRRRSEAFALE